MPANPRGRRAVAVGLLVSLGALPACSLLGDSASVAVAKKFLTDWGAGKYDAAAASTDAATSAKSALSATASQFDARATVAISSVSEKDGQAVAKYSVTWPLSGGTHKWRYDGTLTTTKSGDAERVHWTPTILHPKLTAGDQLQVRTELPKRAPLTDRNGKNLFAEGPVVEVGVQPNKVGDLTAVATKLAAALRAEEIVAADIVRDAKKAKPTEFVPVVTLRADRYNQLKSQIHPLPGTVFRNETRNLSVDRDFAPMLLGRVGDPSAAVLTENRLPKTTTGEIGTSGLQRGLNDRLAGRPGTVVSRVNKAGTSQQLAAFGGQPGKPVRLTLDPRVQNAAQVALAGVAQKAAIVAVRPSTGELLGVAQTEAATYDIALNGRYPAGSTFKIITATALLNAGGVTESTPVACPAATAIDGKTFINQDRFALGQVPLRTAFARSCNTTFVNMATKLPADALPKTASQYGVGAGWKLPIDSFSGSLPTPKSRVEQAADAIGQGKVLVSPMTMALTAAAVRQSKVPAPSLIAGEAAKPTTAPPAIAPNALPQLRNMSRAVVTDGTAAELKNLAGLAGKTGTAEYGSAVPPRSHSWFAGYRGDLAFSVFVEDGATTKAQAATPLAGKFISASG